MESEEIRGRKSKESSWASQEDRSRKEEEDRKRWDSREIDNSCQRLAEEEGYKV